MKYTNTATVIFYKFNLKFNYIKILIRTIYNLSQKPTPPIKISNNSNNSSPI